MNYLPDIITVATQAGEILMSYFHSGFSNPVSLKSDKSPVTQADIVASNFIVEQLKQIDLTTPILTEENSIPDFETRRQWKQYWLIDPLDGTRGFISHSPEFCVNIALIDNHVPILGVIYSPVEKICYYGSKNQGAFLKQDKHITSISVTKNCGTPLRFLCGHHDKNHPLRDTLHRVFKQVVVTQMNSAIKFGLIARGNADVYVRLGKTSEWDTAAGQCIIEAAGGAVVDFHGQPLQYNAKPSLINPSFMAIGDTKQLTQLLAVVADYGQR